MKGKRIVVCLLIVGALVCSLAASASVYGGREAREQLVQENRETRGSLQCMGDLGGEFAAALNATQPIYYTYDWEMDFSSLWSLSASRGVDSANIWFVGGDGGQSTFAAGNTNPGVSNPSTGGSTIVPPAGDPLPEDPPAEVPPADIPTAGAPAL